MQAPVPLPVPMQEGKPISRHPRCVVEAKSRKFVGIGKACARKRNGLQSESANASAPGHLMPRRSLPHTRHVHPAWQRTALLIPLPILPHSATSTSGIRPPLHPRLRPSTRLHSAEMLLLRARARTRLVDAAIHACKSRIAHLAHLRIAHGALSRHVRRRHRGLVVWLLGVLGGVMGLGEWRWLRLWRRPHVAAASAAAVVTVGRRLAVGADAHGGALWEAAGGHGAVHRLDGRGHGVLLVGVAGVGGRDHLGARMRHLVLSASVLRHACDRLR